jgi:hypothetical protein
LRRFGRSIAAMYIANALEEAVSFPCRTCLMSMSDYEHD